ncbi:malate dehydrogenase (oxaloacetate-decarboxylating) [Paenibacillus sp. V4I3]|uniref:NAD-dependent malic enzyme n=1 Tax=unclassified Paenibacillus TaxID=185978 RepID=UPI0027882E9B|nr:MULTISPECIES: NAD-dependent malic enzyme [unclassified Paenibacillus]MDQ0874900.1 malate dehydrogenase (oxaloacetate-decarboxylating) [Paenibacillus sp. V4I3]MDQ0889349.1 malate dehydrogenase (oxaloacetate-decarboxylating) [Paenibacillus sp. V4I9]
MKDTIGGKSIILRVELQTEAVHFGQLITVITENGGDVIAIDVIQTGPNWTVRDITVTASEQVQLEAVTGAIKLLQGVKLVHVSDRTFLLHLGGKIEMKPKVPIQNRDDLSRVYTPDVARVCMAIHEKQENAYKLTIKRNTVAVVSDGSAVLGLGNIGPYAAMPVMEGKAMLFKQLADVDAFPICLDTQNTEEIIATIKNLAPAFGGINLEDISSPRCFEIEERLREELDIPVFHDDQHGTAVVLYAGLINALKVVGKSINEAKVVICGIGAAGIACSNILLAAGVKELIGVDREGALVSSTSYSNPMWNWYAERTNPNRLTGSLHEIIEGADVFIGLSSGGVLKRLDVERMAPHPIVFVMANPTPEIHPDEIEDIAGVIATGRSDFPNQINNVLCFPGIFRAALDCQATTINEEMKLAASAAIASVVAPQELNKLYIIPSVFNQEVVRRIRTGVIEAAIRTGVARRMPREFRSGGSI